MKNSNDRKESNPEVSQMSIGTGSEGYKNTRENLEDAVALAILKDNFSLNPTGSDDDTAIDIKDAIGRDVSLSLVSDNIHIRVEGEIVTLEGEVFREEQKITAGDIATAYAGYDKVNNYLSIIHNRN